MTREELIALAKEAGFDEESGAVIVGYYSDNITEKLERFATLVAVKERESCALVCEEEAVDGSVSMEDAAYNSALSHAAYAIRARKP